MKAKEKLPKSKLATKHIKSRLASARMHKRWTLQDWKAAVFSDEPNINRLNSDGRPGAGLVL